MIGNALCKIAACASISIACAACAPATEVEALERKVALLEAQLADAGQQTKKKIGIDDLDWSLAAQVSRDPHNQPVTLRVGSTGYQVSWTAHGPVAVTFKDIKQLGGGARATLHFVNMTSVHWTGVTLEIAYSNWLPGDLGKEGLQPISKETTHKLTKQLEAATGTLVIVDLPDLPHDVIKDITVRVLPTGMRFSGE